MSKLRFLSFVGLLVAAVLVVGYGYRVRADQRAARDAARQASLRQRPARPDGPGADTQQAAGSVATTPAPGPRRSVVDVPPPRLFRGLRLPAPVLSEQTLVLEVVDDLNRPIPGARVSMKPDTDCGTAKIDTAGTDAAGRVQAIWTLGTKAGVCSAVTRVIGSERFPRVITVVTTNGPAGSIKLVRGGNQRAAFGALLPDFIEVEVRDQFGNIARNERLRFSVQQGGGRIVDYAAVPALNRSTNLRGLARVVWRLGPTGSQRLEVRSLDQAATATPLIITATGVP